ncbi:MAG: hypothetical protein COT18_02460 [Elusimicrobia bacterium CG08_land_8_20_14_0_20_59_10]|nr:MAG: hypothetical protein COT18_02460 [Elusimicrobia bacterium CG08_land_8_20_14_0_20_59_10]
MAKNRNNCIILLVEPPEQEKISGELKTAFGPERAAHVNGDLLLEAYRTLKNFNDAILILSYEKTQQHPDLTWLDPEDPGFLDYKNKPLEERIRNAFQLAFFTGAKKVLLVNHLSPELKEEWLSQAFGAVSDKTVALGPTQEGTFYLLGLTQQNQKILEAPGFLSGKTLENMTERIKKGKLSVLTMPETYCVTSEDSLRKWIENREKTPNFFPEKQEHMPEQKRHNRHHVKAHENTAPPGNNDVAGE